MVVNAEAALDVCTAERADAIELRGAAAVAALRGSIEREDVHQLESFAQLKVVRQLLQAHARCRTPRYLPPPLQLVPSK